MDYAGYILLGAPYMAASFVMNNILRAQGNAFYSMIGIVTGSLLNVILDPIFIFTLDLGIGGAALATILSQLVSFAILLYFCTHENGGARLKLRFFKPSFAIYYEVLRNGLPSFYRQGLASVAGICLNIAAASFGDSAIAAMSIVARIIHFLASAMLGFGQGFMPVCGFNYGAQKYDRVLRAYKFSLTVAFLFFIVMALIVFNIAQPVITLFRSEDSEVIRVGVTALRYQCLVLPLQAWIIISNMLTQSIGKAWQASLISLSRQGIFFIPLIIFLPSIFDISGIQLAQPLADVATALLSIPLTLPILREIKQLHQNR
jgi:putative MATE family efflux protein